MSHNITNKDSIAYAGEVPWHGIGKKVSDVMTASEALISGGLDWDVIPNPIYNAEGKVISGFKAITRKDTGDVFYVSGERYTPIQNRDCFKLFDEVVGTGLAKYEVVGSLKEGRKVWILSRLPYDFSVKGKDEVNSYLLLTTSHDGSLSLQMFETPVRVVCQNTLSASLSGRERGKVAYFKHTINYQSRIGQAQEILASTKVYYDNFKIASEALANKQFTSLQIDSFLNNLFEVEDASKVSGKTKSAIEEVKRLAEEGRGNDIEGIRGTAWAVYNGVTEYVDYERATRGSDDNRLASSWFGSGGALRERAFELLLTK